MKISDIVQSLDAQVLCGEDKLGREIDAAFGSDMMSDALAFMHEKTVLLTGMVNTHVIRTLEMLDVECVVFVRGKVVPDEVLEMGEEQGMVLLSTDKTLYTSCGLLYAEGLRGCERA